MYTHTDIDQRQACQHRMPKRNTWAAQYGTCSRAMRLGGL